MPSLYAGNTGRKFELSSGGLPQAGGSGKLSPVLFSGGGGGYSAPKLNVHGADVRWTDMPVPQNVIDTKLKSAAEFANTAVDAAFEYQQREDSVYSQHAIAQYSQAVNEAYYGGVKDGQPFKGYQHTKDMGSSESFMAFQAGLLSKRDEILSGLSPSARQMAALSMQNSYNSALNSGAKHRIEQLEQAEQGAKAARGQAILANYERDFEGSWIESIEHANSFGEYEQANKVLGEHMSFALDKLDNMALKNGGPMKEENAYWEKMNFFESHKGDLNAEIRVAMEGVLLEERKALDKTADDRKDKAVALRQEYGKAFGKDKMTQILGGGPAGMLNPETGITAHIQEAIDMYPKSPNDAKKKILDDYQGAFKAITTRQGHAMAVVKFEELKNLADKGQLLAGDIDLMTSLEKFVTVDMKTLDDGLTLKERNSQKAYIMQQLRGAKTEQQVQKVMSTLPPSIMGENGMLTFYNNAADSQIKDIQAGWTKQNTLDQGLNYAGLQQMAKGGRTPKLEAKLFNDLGAQRITIGQHDKILAKADKHDQGKINPQKVKVEKDLATTVTNANYALLPDGKTVKPWRVMTADEQEDTRDFYARTKMVPAERELVMQSMLMDQAEAWLSQNDGKDIEDWQQEIYNQSPEEKQNRLLKAIEDTAKGFVNRNLVTLKPDLEVPGPYQYQEKLPDQPVPVYEPETIGGVEGFTGVKSFTPEPHRFRTFDQYVGSTISQFPQHIQKDYSKLSQDDLIGLQMIRELNPAIDKMRIEEILPLLKRVQPEERKAWIKERKNKLQAY